MSVASPSANPTVVIRTDYNRPSIHFKDDARILGLYSNLTTGLVLSGDNIASTATISAGRFFVTYQTPEANNELASKAYVDASAGAGTLTGLFDVQDSDPIGDNYILAFNDATKNWDIQLLNLTESVVGTLPIANGGTNQTSYTTNHMLYYNGTSFVSSSYKPDSFALSSNGTENYIAKFNADGNSVQDSTMIENGTKLDLNLEQLQLNTIYLRENGNELVLNDDGGTDANKNIRVLDAFVAGNLYVSGSTVSITSENVYISDNFMTLNSNFHVGTPSQDAGIEVYRGTEDSGYLIWNESVQRWGYSIGASGAGTSYAGTFSAFAIATEVASDAFKTIDTTNGTSPVASGPDDTLTFRNSNTISSSGSSLNNYVNFDLKYQNINEGISFADDGSGLKASLNYGNTQTINLGLTTLGNLTGVLKYQNTDTVSFRQDASGLSAGVRLQDSTTIALREDANGVSGGIVNGSIVNGHINSSAGIDATKIADGTISNTEFQYLNGTTGNIATTFDYKSDINHTHTAGDVSGLIDGSNATGFNGGFITFWDDVDTLSGSQLYQSGRWKIHVDSMVGNLNTWIYDASALQDTENYYFPLVFDSASGALNIDSSPLYYNYIAGGGSVESTVTIRSQGNIEATGDVYGTNKFFDIPHPDPSKPKGSRLIHSAVESNEKEVYYRGSGYIVNGTATIQLPDYFKYLVHQDTVTCHLTPVGAPMVMWYEEITDEDFELNRVRVSSMEGDIWFSYIIYGVRKDTERLVDEIIST